MKKGQWVVSNYGQEIGRVKDSYEDADYGATIDIVIYGLDGSKIGRTSPVGNGPRSFEPCCDASQWHPIDEPTWPVKMWDFDQLRARS